MDFEKELDILRNMINRTLLNGDLPEKLTVDYDQTLTSAAEPAAPFTLADWQELTRTFAEMRKKTEVSVGGVIINAADYEEVTNRNRQFLPAGWRVFLNVRRTIYDKTFEPLPTDLFLANQKENKIIFAGGNKKEWKPLCNEFIDEERITSKERLLYLAAARSPAVIRGDITEDSRRHLEAEIHAATFGKITFAELEKMEDWRLAYLYKEIFVDKKPIENL